MTKNILYSFALVVALGACDTMAAESPKIAPKIGDLFVEESRPEVVGGASHECYRTCVEGDSRVCHYEFTLVEYSTMARVCDHCPYTTDDCYRRGCVTAGGEPRAINVVNHMLPGPSIQVCKGDVIEVELANNFKSDSTTIHWHGMYQKDTPYMDGVPYITQCPIQPGNKFLYNFTADPSGTHMWHSHIGFQESDGIHGSLVVREADDPLAKYYDYDRAEHVIMIWHWFGMPTSSIVVPDFVRSARTLGHSVIINGLTVTKQYTQDGFNYTTPWANFTVTKGYQYRFRSIANMAIYCPVQVSVDNHTLQMIASDGVPIDPVYVDSYIINAGERYEFVLTANQSVKNYWIRFQGLGKCASNSVLALAILHYEDADGADPLGSLDYADSGRSGVLLNPIGQIEDYPNNSVIKISDLKTTSSKRVNVSGQPDNTFYWTLGLNTYENFPTPGTYAQMNNMSFEFPPIPFLTQYDEITDNMYCTSDDKSAAVCYDHYCTCPTVYHVALGSLTEFLIIDNTTSVAVSHPMHMHGGHYGVVAMEYGNGSLLTLDDVKARNEAGLIEKNFDAFTLKDVIGIPPRGFAVLRIRASNPGYWFFHCHVSTHAEQGMAVVLKIGNDDQMVHPPDNFPTCGDYDITATSDQ